MCDVCAGRSYGGHTLIIIVLGNLRSGLCDPFKKRFSVCVSASIRIYNCVCVYVCLRPEKGMGSPGTGIRGF